MTDHSASHAPGAAESAAAEPADSPRDDAFREIAQTLISGIAHDLSGGLTAIAGVAQILRSGAPPDDELLGALDEQSRRLEGIIRQLRLLPFADRRPPGPASLDTIVADAVALYHARAGADPARIELVPSTDAPVVDATGRGLRETLLLMIGAAEQPDGPGGRSRAIRIAYGRAVDQAYVAVLAGAERFEPRPGSPPAPPAGLTPFSRRSLTEAASVAAEIGASIEIRTEESGTGWTATLRLPAAGEDVSSS